MLVSFWSPSIEKMNSSVLILALALTAIAVTLCSAKGKVIPTFIHYPFSETLTFGFRISTYPSHSMISIRRFLQTAMGRTQTVAVTGSSVPWPESTRIKPPTSSAPGNLRRAKTAPTTTGASAGVAAMRGNVLKITESSSHLRTILLMSSSRPLPAQRPNHAT